MSTEYIWFKNGRESKRTADPEGNLLTLVKPTPNTEIRYEYRQDGSLYSSDYYTDGVKHRDGDKPAYIEYDLHSTDPRVEMYYKGGVIHRDGDKPAYISQYLNGNTYVEQYYKMDKNHRDGDKPSYIKYDPDGSVSEMEYHRDGDLHRDGDNPAYVQYNEDGDVINAIYYKDGVKYQP